MKVYSQLEKAQLENTTSDTSSLPKGMVTYRTDLNLPKVSNGTTMKTLVDTDTTQTLSGKTLTAPVIDVESLTEQGSTPSTPSAGTKKFYAKTDGKLYTLNSAGEEVEVGSGSSSGGTGINLISNGTFDVNATGWSAYADAAGTRPVDGTGGSPTVTGTRTTSTPLFGAGSGLLTKDAANRQGQGISYDFTVSPAHRAKVLNITFDYIVGSGTFVAGSNSSDSDVIVYIYDVTNSTLIEPSSFRLLSNSSTIADKFSATFQTSVTGSSYRLILHCASTSSSAYTLKFDNVSVSPSVYVYGTNITAWKAYTPTFAGFGTVSNINVFSRRVGDSLEVQGFFQTGTNTGVAATMSLAYGTSTGLVVDGSKVVSGTVLGVGGEGNQSTTYFSSAVTSAGTQAYVRFSRQTSTVNNLTSVNGNDIPNSTYISVKFTVPIVGWDAVSQSADGYEGRVIVVGANKNTGNHTSTGNLQDVASWPTVFVDNCSIFNTTTGVITVPRAGVAEVYGAVGFSANGTGIRYATIVQSGSVSRTYFGQQVVGSASIAGTSPFYAKFPVQAGDTIKLQALQSSGGNLNYDATTYLYFSMDQGAANISATELISMRATTANTSIANSTVTTVAYSSVAHDTHNAYNTSTGIYTVPAPGIYRIKGQAHATNSFTSPSIGRHWLMLIKKNGTDIAANGTLVQTTSTLSDHFYFICDTEVSCVTGDQLKVDCYQNINASTSMTLDNTAAYNYITVSRIK